MQTALDGIARTLPSTAGHDNASLRFRVSQWRDETDSNHELTLWLAMAMVSGLLIIGCANLSSILLARGISRRRDYAIRFATGASRMQLIRQSLIEVLLLAFAALGIAWPATFTALRLIRDHLAALQVSMPNLARIQVNSHGLLFSFAIALLSSILCGFFPALSATSISVAAGLRETGTNLTGGRSAHRFLRSLLAMEAGISMLLLLTSGLLVRSLVRLMLDDHGLRSDHVLTLRLPTGSWLAAPTQATSEDQHRRSQSYLALMRQAQAVPGVQAAALASSLPLSNTVVRSRFYAPSDLSEIMPITQAVTGDYFRVMGIPFLSGHTFDGRGGVSKLPSAIVNEAFVRRYFNGEDPVGKFPPT